MDDRPSGGREAPEDRTRRTGRLVRRPPLTSAYAVREGRQSAQSPELGRGRLWSAAITDSRHRDRTSERRAGRGLPHASDRRVMAETLLGRLNDFALSPAPG